MLALRALVLAALLALLTACAGGSAVRQDSPTTAPVSSADSDGEDGAETPLSEGTCWTETMLGADPQAILALATAQRVSYFAAAHALADRPAFEKTRSCAKSHRIEVYRVVQIPSLTPKLTSYAVLLRTDRPLYRALERAVLNTCMTKPLAAAAVQSRLPGAVVRPALPIGMKVSWAPPSPEQFQRGQRVFACTFVQQRASTIRYADVFGRRFPTSQRTCIDSRALVYVDCARKHDRERIAVIDAKVAVLARRFPGPRGIKRGPDGRYLDVRPARYAVLDRACTSYLRAISTTKRLTGIAEIDVDAWPAPDGSYPIACEADTRPEQKPLRTKGSVYNR
ncbi:MAG: hypothetical protein J7518_09665 [Nocardioidaceae bacterium]|nr:hypothetical protein [Nocardioidaceae bacterium]